jgi:Domain of unknown function (DUF4190)
LFCTACGQEINDKAVVCVHCGVKTGRALHAARDPGPLMRMILPIGRSGFAIAAGYLGLFSVLLVPAPLALLFGILAIMDIKKHKDKHGMGRAVFGIVMGAVFTIVLIFSGFAWFAKLGSWGGV